MIIAAASDKPRAFSITARSADKNRLWPPVRKINLNFVSFAITKLHKNPPTIINAITIGNSVWAWAVIASEIGVTPSRPKAVTNKV